MFARQWRLATVWQAFASVCRKEIPVDPKTVIAATFGREYATLHAEEVDQAAAAPVEEQALAEWRDLLARRWRTSPDQETRRRPVPGAESDSGVRHRASSLSFAFRSPS